MEIGSGDISYRCIFVHSEWSMCGIACQDTAEAETVGVFKTRLDTVIGTL